MKPGIPWSVKGVEPELREIAKTAARRSGMTLGEWLNSAINEQADGAPPSSDVATPPARSPRNTLISTHPIERAATKLEDIAEQLSRLAARDSESAYRPHQTSEDPLAFAKVMSRVESNEKQTVEAFSAVNERLATISRQISRSQQAGTPSKVEEAPGFQAMEKAVRNIVEHLEVSDKRTRENMKSLQERMADMATRVASSNSEQVLRQAPAFSQLENRLTDLARRIDQPQSVAAQPTDQLRAELDQLAGRIETVHQTAETLANRAQTQAVQAAQGELRAIEHRITSLLNDARQSFSADHMGPDEVQKFRQEIDAVNARIDDSARNSASDRDVSALKVAVEQLSTRVAQGQDLRPLEDLDKRLVEISQKVERTEAATRGLPQINDLERRFAELDQRLAQSINNPSNASNELLAQKLTEVDDRLSRTEHQLTHLETIERAISQLYDTMEQNRKTAQQVAHDAATRVAEQFASQAAPAALPSLTNAPEIIALQSGLQAVREAAKGADTRNQETLEAVHETLEQIVSKLGELETVGIGQRLAHVTPPATVFHAPDAAALAEAFHAEAPLYEEPATKPEEAEPAIAELFAKVAPTAPATDNPFAPIPEPTNFMASVFAGVAQPLDAAGLQSPATASQTVDAGIGDLVAAARRLHQASHGQANALSGVTPNARAKAPQGKGFQLPFLKSGKAKTKKSVDVLAQADAAAILKPANGNAPGTRVRLIALGLMFLAVATFAVSNMAGRLHHTAIPETSAIVQPQAETTPSAAPVVAAPAPAPTEAPATAAPAQQPEPAPLATPDDKTKTSGGTQQQGDASSVLSADPILTGSVTAAKSDSLAAASAAPITGSVALDPAVGPLKLRHAAESGDSSAAFIVATHFLNGDTVPVDYAKAAYWYGKSAASGVAPAQYRLATLYERGKGVDKNLSAALSWYERAAALGNIKAMHNAAVIAAGNEAGAPDYSRAFKWFSLAANHGVKDSQFNLAVLIERGLGAKQDGAEALFWYMAAAQQDDTDAKTRVEALSKSLGPVTVDAAKARLKAFVPIKALDAANVVAVNDAQWNPQSAAASPPSNINDQAKALLEKLGYRVGDQDGALDTKTANAIKLFQMKQGMKVTGQATPDLIATMQSKAG